MTDPSPGRRHAAELAALLAILLWMGLAMMVVHELGHVLVAIFTGGRLASVELRPGYLSHTLVEPNPRPAVVLWGGFVVGWIAPQLTAPLWRFQRGLVGPALRAWAAFCLLAGGTYLAIGGTERLTDTGQLVGIGWPLPLLIAIGMGVAAIGYARSRSAWIAIAKQLESTRLEWPSAIAWWLWLAVWWGLQSQLHRALEPTK